MSDLIKQIERFEQAQASLRDAVREAHASTKDLRQLERDVRSLVAEAKDVLHQIETAAQRSAESVVVPVIDRLYAEMKSERADAIESARRSIEGHIALMAGSSFYDAASRLSASEPGLQALFSSPAWSGLQDVIRRHASTLGVEDALEAAMSGVLFAVDARRAAEAGR